MKLHIKNVRLTFPHLFEAAQVQGQGEAKYSAAFILPKDHPQKAEIERAMVDSAKQKWGEQKYMDVLKSLKAGDRLMLHDGDAKSEIPGYAGNLFFNAGNKVRPLVIGPDRAPLTAADGKPYSGSYVNVIVEVWAQDNQFGKRVNASLLGVQFVKDGERLAGGGVASADDFEAIPEDKTEAATKSGNGAGGLFD